MAPTHTDPVAAAILAGGRARRMNGVNKAALQIGGVRILDRQLAALRRAADPVFIVADNPEPYAAVRIRVVPDAIAGAGPLGGIYTALLASPRARTLVVGCDMPFLPAAALSRLMRPSDADIVMARSTDGLEPLCAVYASSCAPAILRRIERGELNAAGLAEEIAVEEVGPAVLAACDPHGLLFVNVNTPHDYERALGLVDLEPSADRITDNTKAG